MNGHIRWINQLPQFEHPKAKKGEIDYSGPVLAGGRLIVAGSNGVGNLGMELAYLHANDSQFSGVNLVPGTEAFNSNIVGAVLKGAGLKGLGL